MASQFEYYYGQEAEMYKFYRIPKKLITDSRFSHISSDAKILYGLMLDRMGLSIQNNWRDSSGRVYIQYKIESIASDLGCSMSKAVKVLAELDSKKGIGLVEKVRRGQGRADLIYVKNFMKDCSDASADKVSNHQDDALKELSKNSGLKNDEPNNFLFVNSDIENDETKNSVFEDSDIKNVDYENTDFMNSKNANSKQSDESPLISSNQNSKIQNTDTENSKTSHLRITNMLTQEFSEKVQNNTDLDDTDSNNADLYLSDTVYTDQSINHPNPQRPSGNDMMDRDTKQAYKISSSFSRDDRQDGLPPALSTRQEKNNVLQKTYEQIKKNISYDELITAHPDNKVQIDEIVQLMAETIKFHQGTIRINSQDYPIEAVKERFYMHNFLTIEYVLECLSKTTTKINNIRAYYLTLLYNAPMTIDIYYDAEVKHDMYGL